MKHLKLKYSGHIKETDLHPPRKKSRSDQSLLPGSFCLFQKNFSRSPDTLIWVLQHRFHVSHKFPILFPVCLFLLFLSTAGALFIMQCGFFFFFFNYQTVAVSYHSKLSLSHSGSASLSLLAHLFLPSKQWHTGSRQGKQLPQLSKNRSVCIYELYTSSVKEKFQVNIIKYQKDNGKAWLNHHSDVLELFLCRWTCLYEKYTLRPSSFEFSQNVLTVIFLRIVIFLEKFIWKVWIWFFPAPAEMSSSVPKQISFLGALQLFRLVSCKFCGILPSDK